MRGGRSGRQDLETPALAAQSAGARRNAQVHESKYASGGQAQLSCHTAKAQPPCRQLNRVLVPEHLQQKLWLVHAPIAPSAVLALFKSCAFAPHVSPMPLRVG